MKRKGDQEVQVDQVRGNLMKGKRNHIEVQVDQESRTDQKRDMEEDPDQESLTDQKRDMEGQGSLIVSLDQGLLMVNDITVIVLIVDREVGVVVHHHMMSWEG